MSIPDQLNMEADNIETKASSKISNLRRDLINEFGISKELQSEFIDIAEEVRKLEKELQSANINALSQAGQSDEVKKQLIESIEALLILINPRLVLFDSEIVGKGKSFIWNKVVKTAKKLID